MLLSKALVTLQKDKWLEAGYMHCPLPMKCYSQVSRLDCSKDLGHTG